MKLRVGTENPGKLKEFREILGPLGFEVQGLSDLGSLDVIEDGETFEANALKKAEALLRRTGDFAVADDSGLVVDALDGAPGVRSARYAEDADDLPRDAANNRKLLGAMVDIPDEKRTARFICAIAVCEPGTPPKTFRGTMEGHIARSPRGENGFGYDPLFIVADGECTSAELSPEEKHTRSHRGAALRQLTKYLATRR